MPGRKDAPLCLDSERYINLHSRLSVCGTRGLEMMKGTASIHLHAGLKKIDELPLILAAMIKMSEMDEFKMGLTGGIYGIIPILPGAVSPLRQAMI
jgi:glutamate--cysteine ligase